MAHIILPHPSRGERVVGGVRFLDGKAESVLGTHTRKYFESMGALIRDELEPTVPDERSTKSELVEYALEQGFDVESGTKAEILEAIRVAKIQPESD